LPIVEKYKGSAEKFTTGMGEEQNVERSLKALVPPASIKSAASIVNAGWKVRLQIDDWKILEDIEDAGKRRTEKLRVLRDLLLKSFEVYEYGKRVERDAAQRQRSNR